MLSGTLDIVSTMKNHMGEIPLLDAPMIQSSITQAIYTGNHVLLLECLKQGENPNLVSSSSGCTFLHTVAQTATTDRELSWVPMVFLLSNAGVEMNVSDKEGVTPVGLAISRKLVQIVASLLKCGAEVNSNDMFLAEQMRGVVKSEMMETIRRLTPSYWSAIHDMTPFKVNRLIKAWARVNVSQNGKSLVEYAKQHAMDEVIVQLLLHNEASIELAHAVMAGDRDRAQVILCNSGVDLATSDTSVKNNYFEPFAPLTLCGAAVKLGHSDILNDLKAAQSRMKSYSNNSLAIYDHSVGRRRTSSHSSFGMGLKDEPVVFFKNNSDEVCEIRTANKPVVSALCTII